MVTQTFLGQHQFNGPFSHVSGLLQQSGVYIISTILHDGTHKVIDVGESQNVQDRVTSHDRASSWNQHIVNGLYVSAHYCDEFSRMLIEQAIRKTYYPPCGVR